ncbi:hypothetical protein HPB49_001891 [Dermacentor silvarum]|uniref:Uncharacterized protein n=1 Tax=Dermacentor silvarum TaxID=543639 RepID=A0ACB8DT29_DERSI|nr:hypothetical protein HPB49_001891 [Dermacentor silvarum]
MARAERTLTPEEGAARREKRLEATQERNLRLRADPACLANKAADMRRSRADPEYRERENQAKRQRRESDPGLLDYRLVNGPTTKTGLKITMYQYQTCPFCCKVRAFLDFYGIPYNVIEVDPVLRQQLKFSEYKKVPILLVEEADNCWQINDSTVIISMLQSYLRDIKGGIRKYLCLYDPVKVKDASGKESLEVFNKYFLMMDNPPAKGKAFDDLKEEMTWRMWADDVLVHVLSPNVYRTWQEALQAFNYFSEVGEWEKNFPTWERLLVVYVGAAAMYFVAKRLKKR